MRLLALTFMETEGTNMLIRRSIAAATLAMSVATMAHAQNVLYQHNFDGSATATLHTLAPDVNNNGGGTTWVTRTDTGLRSGTGLKWFDDGTMSATPGGSGAASLGFRPIAGNIYTLTARINGITSSTNPDNWFAMGFASGQATGSGAGAEFYGNPNVPDQLSGQPWMLFRSPASGLTNQTFRGPGTEGGGEWTASSTFTGAVDMRIVLNTTAAQWTAEWFAKAATDVTFTSLRGPEAYTTNPNIRSVAMTVVDGISGSIESFALATSGSVYTAGDTNGNGMADVADFNTIRNNYFNSVLGPTSGDVTNDGIVNHLDFRVWKNAASPAVLAAVGIPEPSSLTLGSCGLMFLLQRVARRRKLRSGDSV
jgi:hypothetical protein